MSPLKWNSIRKNNYMIESFVLNKPVSSSGTLFKAPRTEYVSPDNDGDTHVDRSHYSYFSTIFNSESDFFAAAASYSDSDFNDNQKISGLLSEIEATSENLGFGAIHPKVTESATKVLNILYVKDINHHNVYALAEGGISIEIIHDGYFYSIALYNDLDGSLIRTNKDDIPHAWELDFDELLEMVKGDML